MKPKVGDFFVYVFIVIIVSLSFLGLRIMAKAHNRLAVVVEVHGKVVESLDLFKEELEESPRDIRVDTDHDGYNIVRIQGGQVQIVEANCPDRLCVNSPPIKTPGQSIVCIPHRLIVRINGIREEDAVDDTAS